MGVYSRVVSQRSQLPRRALKSSTSRVGLAYESFIKLAVGFLCAEICKTAFTGLRRPSIVCRGVQRLRMLYSTCVLSTVSSDTEPTLLITVNNSKYIFNAGENTGRAFMEYKRGWKNTRAVFLTSVGTQRTSGLPGTSRASLLHLCAASLHKLCQV